jgi:hypothetical protein
MTACLRSTCAALCLLAVALYVAPGALAAEAAMSVDLPSGRHKAVRLRNLPKGAVMAVVVQTSGPIAISLLSESEYRRFPKIEDPVFLGTVDRKLSFTVTIPDAGNFYLVLDNRRAQDARKVKFLIRAQRGRTPEGGEPEPAPKEGEQGT